MSVAYVIVAILLSALLLASARAKITKEARVTKTITDLGVPLGWFPFLAACEAAGAVGLIVGIWFTPLGVAAAIGVVAYFGGAIGAHLRAHDTKGASVPLVVFAVTVVTLVLRLLSA